MSDAVTRGIRVQVEAHHIPDRSMPEQDSWFFAYQVTIQNVGERSVQLLSRHWIITDGMGRVQEVRGSGVVGEQPRLAPGQSFRYTSACPLGTEIGTMHGSYQMVDEDGEHFDVEIAPFTLAVPTALN
jgi:ApaG protein